MQDVVYYKSRKGSWTGLKGRRREKMKNNEMTMEIIDGITNMLEVRKGYITIDRVDWKIVERHTYYGDFYGHYYEKVDGGYNRVKFYGYTELSLDKELESIVVMR